MRDVYGRLWMVSWFFLCFNHFTQSQETKPVVSGQFLSDSVEIGQTIGFRLVADYPDHMQALFPDSLLIKEPFEYISREYWPTRRLDNQLLRDSAVYFIQTFEIDPVQYLSLPVTFLKQLDTLKITSSLDSVLLKELVPEVTDTTQLIVNTYYQKVWKKFNTPLYLIILSILGVLGVIVGIIFTPSIRKYFLIKKMKADYAAFDQAITEIIHQLKDTTSKETAEKGLVIWKKYLEKLEKVPYAKSTTAELLAMPENNVLKDALRSIDKLVYGGISHDLIIQSFQELEDAASERFRKRLEEVIQKRKTLSFTFWRKNE